MCECLHLQLSKCDRLFDSWLLIRWDSLHLANLSFFFSTSPKIISLWNRCQVVMVAITCPPSTEHTPTIHLTWVRGSAQLHVCHPAPALNPKQQVSPTHTHTHTYSQGHKLLSRDYQQCEQVHLREVHTLSQGRCKIYKKQINSKVKLLWESFVLVTSDLKRQGPCAKRCSRRTYKS